MTTMDSKLATLFQCLIIHSSWLPSPRLLSLQFGYELLWLQIWILMQCEVHDFTNT